MEKRLLKTFTCCSPFSSPQPDSPQPDHSTWSSNPLFFWASAYAKSLSLGLLTFSAAVSLPLAAEAASFSPDSRAGIALFRGAGSLVGFSGPSGIDSLAQRIDNAFADEVLSVQVFDSYKGNIFNFQEVGSTQANPFIDSFSDTSALGLIGYSAGGVSAIRTAKNKPQKAVDLLVQIESYDPLTGRSQEDEVLPENVETGINYYQRRNRYNFFRPGWDLTDLQGAKNVSGSQNINAEDLFGDRSITHRSIVNDIRLQDQIVRDIQANIVDKLPWNNPQQLVLASDMVSTDSLQAMTEEGAIALLAQSELDPTFDSQNLSEASLNGTDAESVPEPNLLLAMMLFGGGLWMTNGFNQSNARASST